MASEDAESLISFGTLLVLLDKKSRQFVYRLMRRDKTFPRPVTVGSEFSIAWKRREIVAWINARPRATLDGLSAVERRERARANEGRESANK